jgi:hypothetical protein
VWASVAAQKLGSNLRFTVASFDFDPSVDIKPLSSGFLSVGVYDPTIHFAAIRKRPKTPEDA